MISWLTKDWGVKLVSLLLAVGLWHYAVGEESVEVKRIVPVEIAVKNPQMSILKSSVKNVWITFSAPRNILSDLTTRELKVTHTIQTNVKTAGEYSFRIESREIRLPSPLVKIIKIDPETVHVTLDELIAQKVKIKPAFIGEPAFGYTVREDEIQIDPNAIMLEGPKEQLQKMDAVYTQTIDLVGRIRSFRRTLELNLPPNIRPLSEALVEIFIPIKEEFGEKQFEDVPVKVLRSPGDGLGVKMSTEKINFILKGPRLQLEKLEPENLLAYLDLTGYGKGDYEVPVRIVLPDDVSVKEEVSVQVYLMPIKS